MSIIIPIMCLFMISVSLTLDKKIYNPSVIFNIWWGVTILVSGLGLLGMDVPNYETYFYIMIAIVAFNLPTVFIKTKQVIQKDKFELRKDYELFFSNNNIKLILILQTIVVLVLVSRTFNVINLLLSGYTYNMIRYYYYYSDLILTNQYSMLINNVFVTPITIFSALISILSIFNQFRNKWILFLSVLIIALYSFSSGGRGIIMYVALSVLITFFINQKEQNFKLKSFLKLFAFIILLVLSLVVVSLFRANGVAQLIDLAQTVIVYFTGSFRYFEIMMPVIEQESFLLGSTFFGGIWDFIILLFNFFGLELNQISSHIAEHNQNYQLIGEGIEFNAFTTMLYPFMYDFGKLGIIIQPFFFGLLSRFFYIKMERHRTIKYKGIYLVIVIIIYESVFRWMGIYTYTWIIMFMFYIFEKLSTSNKSKY